MTHSYAEFVGRELVREYGGGFISRRDGLVLVKIRDADGKTAIVWIRESPITKRSLELLRKVVKKHEHDRLVLVRLYGNADYVKPEELQDFEVREVLVPEEAR